jgi:two-component system chemotaxis response regulator CheY
MKPLNILIVDDSATMRKMVRRVVELSEVAIADIYEAANGREALDVIDSRPVDALFTDINMPVMTGVELLKRMAAESKWSHVLRVIISTDASDVRRQEVSDLNVRHYVQKPVRPEAVCDVLSQLVAS